MNASQCHDTFLRKPLSTVSTLHPHPLVELLPTPSLQGQRSHDAPTIPIKHSVCFSRPSTCEPRDSLEPLWESSITTNRFYQVLSCYFDRIFFERLTPGSLLRDKWWSGALYWPEVELDAPVSCSDRLRKQVASDSVATCLIQEPQSITFNRWMSSFSVRLLKKRRRKDVTLEFLLLITISNFFFFQRLFIFFFIVSIERVEQICSICSANVFQTP